MKNLSLKLAVNLSFGSRLLLALGPFTSLREADGCLVELCLALVGRLAIRQFKRTRGFFLVSLVCEEQCRLNLNFTVKRHLDFVKVSPGVVSLVVERISSTLRRAHGVEVRLSRVAGLVELVHHILIKLFRA